MKKIFVCVLSLVIALGLFTACGNHDPGLRTYTVYCYGAENAEEIAGVVIQFCTDTACTTVTSDAQGAAVFTGPPANYHVKIVTVPGGWEPAQEETEWDTGTSGEVYRLPFRATGN